MRIRYFSLTALAVAAFFAEAAFGMTQRTFVGPSGSDANPCSLTQPCRSFAAAVANTSASGEVIVLDSAGYGPVTLGKSVSITAPAGIYAGITVTSGHGVDVHAAEIGVTLRGLVITGLGGTRGINFDLGSMLTVVDCEVSGMTEWGIYTSAPDSQTTITRTLVRNNTEGIAGNGFRGTVRVAVVDSTIANSAFDGALSDSNAGSEVQFQLTRSVVTGNSVGLELISVTGSRATFFIEDTTIMYAKTAAFELDTSPTQAIYTTGRNTVGYVGAIIVGGGTLTPCCAM